MRPSRAMISARGIMEPIDVYKMLSDAGKERLNDGDIRSINAYRREHGLKTLTLDEAKEAKR